MFDDMNHRIYLDHAATTPVSDGVIEAMMPYLKDSWGNPSSLHQEGNRARKALNLARETLATYLGGQSGNWTFTASGTEGNNLLIQGWAKQFEIQAKRHVVTTAMEHPCVLKPFQALEQKGWCVSYVPLTSEGFVTVEALAAVIRPETRFVSMMHGNNEVGSLQNLSELGTFLQSKGIWFHTDAVQTVGKMPIDLSILPVDALTLSAHKLYGPKGVGALYCRKETPLHSPLLFGGGQESGMRSGTENIAGIVGLATALRECCDGMASETVRLNALQSKLIEGIKESIPSSVFNGPTDLRYRVPGNVNFSFPPMQGESLVVKLDMKGFAVSSGSACHSAVIEPSHVLLALGKSREEAISSLRFSMGRHTQSEHIDVLLEILPNLVAKAQMTRVHK